MCLLKKKVTIFYLENKKGGQFLLSQDLNWGSSNLAEVPLATVLVVHGGNGVKDELLADLLVRDSRPLSPPGGGCGKTSQSASNGDGSQKS